VNHESEPIIAAHDAEPESRADEVPADDYDMPAILRKQRRMVQ